MKLLGTICLFLIFFTSCEDDPIVEPQKSGSTSGGSYARLSFPDSTQFNNLNP